MKRTLNVCLLHLGGHADNSIKIISSDGAKTLETASAHCAPVTCIALSADSKFLVTGSRDTTVILWKIHQVSASSSSTISDASTGGGGTPTAASYNKTLANILTDRTRKCRIEGPLHVLRGHRKEITCCCISSELGIVVSCAQSSDVLLHSMRGRLIRRLEGVEADAVSVSSSRGVIMAWNKSQHKLSTFTLNGVPIASAQLPSSCTISCIEISLDGEAALVGVNSPTTLSSSNSYRDFSFKKSYADDSEEKLNEVDPKLDVSSPAICLLDLHTLKVLKTFEDRMS